MNSRVPVLAFLVLTILSAASQIRATQVLYRTPQQLGAQSSLVVRGRVAEVRSFWNGKRTKIFTETTVIVEETYKGGRSAAVRVVQLGGIVDNVKVTVAGALRWAPEEEVLLFLEPYTAGTYQVSGFSQGKFRVDRDPLTKQPFVTQPAADGIQLVGGTPRGDAPARASRIERVPLERFVNQALGRQ